MLASAASATVVGRWHMDEPSGAATMTDSAGTGTTNTGTMGIFEPGKGVILLGSPFSLIQSLA